MPHPFFDAVRFPWHRDEAQAVHKALYQAVGQPPGFAALYAHCGPNLKPLTPGLAADDAWHEILDYLTFARRLDTLCQTVLGMVNLLAVHPAITAIQNARDLLIDEPTLPNDLVFVDRKPLRLELQKLVSVTASQGVLLVRGPSGSGKSWTELLVADLATSLGARCIYIFEGLVSTVDEVVAQLFTLLDEPQAVPPRLETEDAWFRKVCLDLQALGQKHEVVSWIIADDLGSDANGPRLDPMIRRFFDQFALTMANPAFAQWFRLVLLDYPEGDVPTKWKANVWVEDRPTEQDLTHDRIVEFLRARAERMQKQIADDRARKFAVDILTKVDSPQPVGAQSKPRLRRLHDELVGVLAKL